MSILNLFSRHGRRGRRDAAVLEQFVPTSEFSTAIIDRRQASVKTEAGNAWAQQLLVFKRDV